MAVVGFTPELIGRLMRGVSGRGRRHEGQLRRRASGSSGVCREFPDLTVFAGTEKFLLDTLHWGGDGCISATVNVTARQAREVYDLWAAGEDATAAQAALTERREFLDGFPTIPALKALRRLAEPAPAASAAGRRAGAHDQLVGQRHRLRPAR